MVSLSRNIAQSEKKFNHHGCSLIQSTHRLRALDIFLFFKKTQQNGKQ